MLRFAWGLQPEDCRVVAKKLALVFDWGWVLRRGFLPWDSDQRETTLSALSVRNCGDL